MCEMNSLLPHKHTDAGLMQIPAARALQPLTQGKHFPKDGEFASPPHKGGSKPSWAHCPHQASGGSQSTSLPIEPLKIPRASDMGLDNNNVLPHWPQL